MPAVRNRLDHWPTKVGGPGVNLQASMKRLMLLQSGQGMVEYALILALVALIVIVALIATGGQLINLYSTISTTMCQNHVGC
jgi:pilus assembly protein Flp/PilA